MLREIVDPNHSVSGPYVAYTAVRKDGTVASGLVRSESAEQIVLREQDRITVLPRADIVTLSSQRLSLMPEKMEETIGVDGLRDLLAYLAPASRFRALDLRLAANADSTRGLFTALVNTRESLPFKSFGAVEANGVRFRLLHPAASNGRNIIVLRGGPEGAASLASTYPVRATVPCGVVATRFHILGGVGAWAFPETQEAVPVLTVILRYASGEEETLVWRNGVEIANYQRYPDVPASKPALRLRRRQVRHISVAPARSELVAEIEFRSAGGPVAPVVVAVTAEIAPDSAE